MHIRYKENGILKEQNIDSVFISLSHPEEISDIQIGTGLRDKNGKEIFCGDRLYDSLRNTTYEVSYLEGRFVANVTCLEGEVLSENHRSDTHYYFYSLSDVCDFTAVLPKEERP